MNVVTIQCMFGAVFLLPVTILNSSDKDKPDLNLNRPRLIFQRYQAGSGNHLLIYDKNSLNFSYLSVNNSGSLAEGICYPGAENPTELTPILMSYNGTNINVSHDHELDKASADTDEIDYQKLHFILSGGHCATNRYAYCNAQEVKTFKRMHNFVNYLSE